MERYIDVKSEGKLLSGRDVGERMRREFELSKYDSLGDNVVIDLTGVFSVTASFMLGFLGPSMSKDFHNRYSFKCDENTLDVLAECLDRAEKMKTFTQNPLRSI